MTETHKVICIATVTGAFYVVLWWRATRPSWGEFLCSRGRHDFGWFEGRCDIDGIYQRCRRCGDMKR